MTGTEPTVRDQIAEQLAGHDPIYQDGYLTGEPPHFTCECGEWVSRPGTRLTPDQFHRRHLADELMPIVEAACREAAARSLDEAADYWDRPLLRTVTHDLRERARAAARGRQT